MEKLKKIIATFRASRQLATEDEILNVAREYLQILILKMIYQSRQGAALSFMGGTCLRLCYDLKRYSEDLDFCLDLPSKDYRFPDLMRLLERETGLLGFSVRATAKEEKTVQKGFLKISDLGEGLQLKGFRREQKLHIKLEVDTHPPHLKKLGRESFFVNRYSEIYPILKQTLPTLFAGKVLAILQRPFTRGRDYYDLIWYLGRKTPLDLDYLNRGLREKKLVDSQAVSVALEEKVASFDAKMILKDIGHFLEDPAEENWIQRYGEVFEQLKTNLHTT
ncbi:MAG: nucleotidyl transferase AbiEii/AbiGii toxin family protein [Deltaproteobacteria bacterium]|nr:nucleotidyl transferase AbiEii/AbiGii toxin family protein [Deltaproteobacteria bacterium]